MKRSSGTRVAPCRAMTPQPSITEDSKTVPTLRKHETDVLHPWRRLLGQEEDDDDGERCHADQLVALPAAE